MRNNSVSAEWDKANTTQIKLKLNIRTDSDIIAWLTIVSNKQGYIKQLIRNDLERMEELKQWQSAQS